MRKYNDASSKQEVLEALAQFQAALEEMQKGVLQLRSAVRRKWPSPKGKRAK